MLDRFQVYPVCYRKFNKITTNGLNKIKEYAKDVMKLRIEEDKVWFTPIGCLNPVGSFNFDFNDYGTENSVLCFSGDHSIVVAAVQLWLGMRGYIANLQYLDKILETNPELKPIYISAQGILMENHML